MNKGYYLGYFNMLLDFTDAKGSSTLTKNEIYAKLKSLALSPIYLILTFLSMKIMGQSKLKML